MKQSVEDALWRKYRRERRSMTEWNALFDAIRDEAKKRGWFAFIDQPVSDGAKYQFVQFVDTRPQPDSPPPLGVKVSDSITTGEDYG